MGKPLKDIFFQKEFFLKLVKEIKKEYSKIDQNHFLDAIYDEVWEEKELRQRMKHVAEILRQTLPDDYMQALEVLMPVSQKFKGFEAIVFSDFVEQFGLDDYDESIKALEIFTVEASSESAVRPFIEKYPEKMIKQMLKWAKNENEHVRRLASEGCRPKLPWAIRLHQFVKDPSPILPILEKLKDDESEYVRRSVANNLNDISKDHPELVLEIASRWVGKSKDRNRLVKHALRTLLKQGNREAMMLFGYGEISDVVVKDLKIEPKKIQLGDTGEISFEIELKAKETKKLRLEYAVFFMKKNGHLSKKVFHLSEKEFDPGKKIEIKRILKFHDLTTRKHYPGTHELSLIVNGVEMQKIEFELV